MVSSVKMFRKVIGQVFLAGVPCDMKVPQFDLGGDPEKVLFHRAGSLLLDCIICNRNCSGVVTVYWSGRLGMAEFRQTEAEDGTVLAIVKKGTQFGLCCGCNDKFTDVSNGEYWTIQLDRCGVRRDAAKEKGTSKAAPCSRFREV